MTEDNADIPSWIPGCPGIDQGTIYFTYAKAHMHHCHTMSVITSPCKSDDCCLVWQCLVWEELFSSWIWVLRGLMWSCPSAVVWLVPRAESTDWHEYKWPLQASKQVHTEIESGLKTSKCWWMLMASRALASFMGTGSLCVFLGILCDWFWNRLEQSQQLPKWMLGPWNFVRSMQQLELVQGVSDCHWLPRFYKRRITSKRPALPMNDGAEDFRTGVFSCCCLALFGGLLFVYFFCFFADCFLFSSLALWLLWFLWLLWLYHALPIYLSIYLSSYLSI